MEINFGVDASTKKAGNPQNVVWNSNSVVNPHMLIIGVSGTGKTFNLKKIAKELVTTNQNNKFRLHIFDVHGDINIEESIASTVLFSESTRWGMNPLKINPDPHFGGVRKRVQGFVTTLNKVMRSLGPKQEATLRNLLMDLYKRHGFDINNHATWDVPDFVPQVTGSDPNRLYLDIPFHEKEMAKKHGPIAWDGEVNCWYILKGDYTGGITKWGPKYTSRTHPTISDLLRFTRIVLEKSYLGTGSEAVANLEQVNKAAARLYKKTIDTLKATGGLDDKADADLEKAKQKAIESYTAYVESITTGVELETVMKYDSVDVLKSVLDRIENLDAIGIFKHQLPPFEPEKKIWRYDIKSLLLPEKKLFVLFKLEELFNEAVQRGEQREIIDVVLVDEGHIFRDGSDDNIIDTIVKEARKFGLALICASQSPSHFSSDFLSQTGTKVVLGLDETQYKAAESKLMIQPEALRWLRPQRSMLVNCKRKGSTEPGQHKAWNWTIIQ